MIGRAVMVEGILDVRMEKGDQKQRRLEVVAERVSRKKKGPGNPRAPDIASGLKFS